MFDDLTARQAEMRDGFSQKRRSEAHANPGVFQDVDQAVEVVDAAVESAMDPIRLPLPFGVELSSPQQV
jgi:hypothetical protein